MHKIRNFEFLGVAFISAFALVFVGFHLLQAQAEIKGKPPKPVPKQAFDLPNIETAESNALRIWKLPSLDPSWSTETPVNYAVVASDMDNDPVTPDRILAVPGIQEVRVKGNISFKKFLKVYKEGESGIWRTTKDYGGGYFIDGFGGFCGMKIANVIPEEDGSEVNEIFLLDMYNLVVFRWDGDNFKIVKQIKGRENPDLPGLVFLNAIAIQDNQIYVSGDSTYLSRPGYVGKI